ncbi:hypothetical protein QUH73_13705 [Labilibaculum sp. K2S]|uniref:hypothetical protein n=1 Tax=Labilibaculum sp. K2S TaxID=3056386 RepID=UPI0025A42EEE|nr:hypothetical protein [Labilibaculum sp. K2S]MDM8160874.1 hypothetical protein [Labilibaculum sp. K2S]
MKVKTHLLSGLLLLLITTSCSQKDTAKKEISFYHWKSKAEFNSQYQESLKSANANKIYLHYFDIISEHEPNWYDDGIVPTYVLKSVAKEYKEFEIVPVVYITNRVFQVSNLEIQKLSNRIRDLVNQISLKHFNKKIAQIQIDCDWTESTKYAYFELLENLGEEFDLDVTIRLHQIKFKERTGIPPVKKGTLMLYNVGDLKDMNQNSILQNSIVKQYIDSETKYPLPLNIALPLFSQTVIKNKDNEIKIIKNAERTKFKNDPHFKQVDVKNFQVVKDTLCKGFYLSEGYEIKLEELSVAEIVNSYQTIKESKLITNGIIFYHMDEKSLSNINLSELVEKL